MISIFYCSLTAFVLAGVQGWSYHYSNTNMTYEHARKFCRTTYTDLVAIQNREENEYLNSILPFNPNYYWIGIRLIKNHWTWEGTKKILTEEAKNWALGEPNNKKSNEDCVEMYIKRTNDSGKWNDEPCKKKKVALCYTAACSPSSCSGHGDCIETINNYTCSCYEGFYGSACEHVVECPRLVVPELGSMKCEDENGKFKYNSNCSFSCNEGFALTDSNALQCTASGSWSLDVPACEAVVCPTIPVPEHGSMECEDDYGEFQYNSKCSFSCNEGFILTGSNSLHCTSSGSWSSGVPTCEAVVCPPITIPEHSSMECEDDYGEFQYNSNCSFSCKEGFILTGSNSLHCNSSRSWSSDVPACKALDCSRLVVPELGSMECVDEYGEFQYNSKCSFSCNEGFILTGSKSVQCTSSGSWSSDVPACQVVQCDTLKDPTNGFVKCPENLEYNSTCSFTCAEGYNLVGLSEVQCLASGDWMSPPPICEVVQCTSLNNPKNGWVKCEEKPHYKSRCTYACAEGYKLSGSSERQCLASGEWTSSVPTCEAVQCEPLKHPENGFVKCPENSEYNSTCSFTCAEGYNLVGLSEVQCLASGEWMSPPPICEVVQCTSLNNPENGWVKCEEKPHYKSKCTYACAEGYKLSGSSERQCLASGKWTSSVPTCEVVQCETLKQPENGFVKCPENPEYNSTCSFTCAEGYNLVGLSEVQCLASGEWMSPPPICKVVQCTSLNNPKNGWVKCEEKPHYKSKCTYACAEGYKLSGSSEVQCLASGEWTSSVPTCEAVQCEPLKQPENGFVKCPENPEYNSTCSFTCAEGYNLVGLSEVQCLASAKWASPPPICEVVRCASLNNPENGWVKCQEKPYYKSKCSYACAEGYKLSGSSERQCLPSGEWTFSAPTCEAVECKVPLIPDMGTMNCSHPFGDFKYGSVCKFDCEGDRLLNGTNTLECKSTGTWSSEVPACEAPKIVPDSGVINVAVGVAATGASLLSVTSLLVWLVKRLRKSAKKFTPSSSCQKLEEAGVYQNIEDHI
ncbi:E-selectin [Xenopus laevis]|uniref:E-selectin n=2 Tax=Xenopus laevis TaxID=8355 RepID=A0A974D4G1_XENLA|nr:E-selectin [Xenopus laevis]OCT85434.1 hypothetical protein XELAEV_18023601mg [Xenopus laevis]